MTTEHDAGPSQAELIEELHRAQALISALSDRYLTRLQTSLRDDRRSMAADPPTPPVVLMSGHGQGRDDVLPKPFAAAHLPTSLGAAHAGNGEPA